MLATRQGRTLCIVSIHYRVTLLDTSMARPRLAGGLTAYADLRAPLAAPATVTWVHVASVPTWTGEERL